jgi:hypothetical protein
MMSSTNEQFEIDAFAASIKSRLRAEARTAKAMAFVWICGGLAAAFVLCGLGFGAATLGVSRLLSATPAAEETAKLVVEAFKRAETKTIVSGTMVLAPNSELRLAANQTIKLEDPTIVQLDPSSAIRVVGDLKVDVPRPSQQQLQLDTTSKSEELPFTTYTIFRSYRFGGGEVNTGWNFDLSDTTRPRFQFCYYSQDLDRGLTARYTIAINGQPRRPSELSQLTFDFEGALLNCSWFSGF